jgi:hypothetical protein
MRATTFRELPVGPRGHEPQAGVRAGALLPGEAVERFVGAPPSLRDTVLRGGCRRADSRARAELADRRARQVATGEMIGGVARHGVLDRRREQAARRCPTIVRERSVLGGEKRPEQRGIAGTGRRLEGTAGGARARASTAREHGERAGADERAARRGGWRSGHGHSPAGWARRAPPAHEGRDRADARPRAQRPRV